MQLVAFAEFVVSDDEDFDEHLPFMAVEPRSAHGKSRRGGNQRRRQISEEDALDALYGLRNELEVRHKLLCALSLILMCLCTCVICLVILVKF
jgi:hypothetical protein